MPRSDRTSQTLSGPPAAAGFRMPAEWSRHERCWMAWPCRDELWAGRLFEARAAYAQVARAIARFEPVTMAVRPDQADEARAMLGARVTVLELPLDDSWARDIGPSFLTDGAGRLAGADWRFNAWGEKFVGYDEDAAFAGRLLAHLGVPRFAAPFVLEGGSIHVDGAGTVLTSEQCLLNPNRNPGMSRAEIERALCDWLGARTVIWLGEGLTDDGTDGHVDNLACFVRPGVVLAQITEDPADANYRPLQDNLRRLRAARDAAGRPLEVLTVEQPGLRMRGPERMALSYVNFYLANGAVIAPGFDDPRDAAAADILRSAFPDRSLVQLKALDILWGGGGIHCITQQQPAA